MMFDKILVANRGEVALRVMRAARELGVKTVAVYSTEDADTYPVRYADEAVCIGPAQANKSYLVIPSIIAAAKNTGAQAIHPGYGFLAENADFARACIDNDIVFIGPSPECIDRMGDKSAARETMKACGVPTVPGSDGCIDTVEEARAFAENVGFPVLIKATAGGGGKGMREVHDPAELESQYLAARAEAGAAFGNDGVYLEKLVLRPRHVEIQVLADDFGNNIALCERDCSVQRRHQKLIEESPSPAVSRSQRKKLMDQVTKAVKAIGYVGVGTLEFLLDRDGRFWFMEMNLRLQVEHGVTEMLTKIDLVKWQIRVAAGVPLNFRQQDVSLSGACLECRINATRPGTLTMLHVPGGPFVRFDTYLVAGTTVSPYYDSLLGKLIVYAGTREEALRKMKAALCELMVEGIETNIAEQLDLVSRPDFMDGSYDLTFLEGE